MTPIAQIVGSNRIIPGLGIVHPVGDADLSRHEEKRIRLRLIEKAVEALAEPISDQTIFETPS
jgi:glycine reductase